MVTPPFPHFKPPLVQAFLSHPTLPQESLRLMLLYRWLSLGRWVRCRWSATSLKMGILIIVLFPTCQVRVVRFYHSCSPAPRLAILLLLLLLLLRQHLLRHLCLHFHVHCCLASSSPNLFANVRAQCAPPDLNLGMGPSQLSGHRWTSTWDLPSSVGTAGSQRGTCPAQCAPLDLTWDLPSSVCTAGPQPGTCPAQCAPLDLNGQIEC